MSLHDGIDGDVYIFAHAFLPGHPNAAATFIELKPVVLTYEVLAFQKSHRERQQAVRTTIFKCGNLTVRLPIQHDGLSAHRPGERSVLDVGIPGDRVPEVAQEHGVCTEFEIVHLREGIHIDSRRSLSTMQRPSKYNIALSFDNRRAKQAAAFDVPMDVVLPQETYVPAQYRADHIGSFLRPPELLQARHDGASSERLRELEDRNTLRVLAKQKELGFDVFTDGELRRRNFMSDFTDAVEGFDLGDAVARSWQANQTKASSVSNVTGIVTKKLRAIRPLTSGELDF